MPRFTFRVKLLATVSIPAPNGSAARRTLITQTRTRPVSELPRFGEYELLDYSLLDDFPILLSVIEE